MRLLNSENNNDASFNEASGIIISDFEKDTIGEIGNISMGTSATTLSTLLRKKVSITTPNVSVTTLAQLQSEYPLPYVVIKVQLYGGYFGNQYSHRTERRCRRYC